MKERKKRFTLVWIIFIMYFLSFWAGSIVANAEETMNQKVKVGFFKMDCYHEMDDEGNRSGYGYEFFARVSKYCNMNFSYEGYNNTWEQMIDMLESGEIEILSYARKTEERKKKFCFTKNNLGTSYSILTAKKGNKKIKAGDYDTYQGMKVGLVRESGRNDGFAVFAQKHKFNYKPVYYNSDYEAADAMQNGEVDTIVTNNFRKYDNEVLLDSFDEVKFYAMARKGNERLLERLDAAIGEMDTYESNWRIELNDKYLRDDTTKLHLTDEENEFIKQCQKENKVFKVICNPDRYPYSYFEDGKARGIVPDIFSQIMTKAGLKYEVVQTSTRKEYHEAIAAGDIDIVMDQQIDAGKAENLGYLQTIPYLTTSLCRLQHKDLSVEDIKTIAAIQASEYQIVAAKEDVRNCELKYYDNYWECFDAIRNKEADAAYLLLYVAEICVGEDATDTLTYTTLTGSEYEMGVGIQKNLNYALASVLSKCVYRVKRNDVQPIVDQYLSDIRPTMTPGRFLVKYPWVAAAAVLFIVLAVAFFIRYVFKTRSEKMLKIKNAEMARQNSLIEEQMAVIEGLASEYFALFLLDMNSEDLRLYLHAEDEPKKLKVPVTYSYNYSEAMGKYIDQYVKEEERENLKQQIELEQLVKLIPQHGIYSVNYERNVEGKVDHCQMNFANVLNNKDKYVVVLGFRYVNKIVERELHQKQLLEDALVRAEQASRAKTTFLSNMSHDIRTPMNAIIGFTALATTHIHDVERVKDYLGKIMTSGNHLLSLINDVLDMSRIESGKMKLDEYECNLAEVMHDLKNIIQADIRSKQLELFIDTVDVLDEDVYCDRLRLNQVFLNLLGNAMKFTPSGGTISVRIIEKRDAPDGYASYEFRIKDTGIGMSPEFLKNIFEPFERERNSTVSKIPGTGLGMPITKSIVDMMGGTISVASEMGKGTEFVIHLQFRLQTAAKKTEKIPALEGMRALVVDDDFNTCDSVTNMLIQIGMRAEWTLSGKEAVLRTKQAIERNDSYFVYILDWLIPDMNGVEAARRIRQEAGEETPIIILTAYDWADIEDEAKEAGVTAFCSKPLFMSELRKCLIQSCYPEEESEEAAEEEEKLEFKGRRILLVEDNELNREIATEVLSAVGLLVEEAEDGQIAVECVSNADPGYYDLVLMDIQMPNMDGYEATREIRKLPDPERANVPIIAMTANAFEEDRKLALESGMNEHMAKPIDISVLMELLKKHIDINEK